MQGKRFCLVAKGTAFKDIVGRVPTRFAKMKKYLEEFRDPNAEELKQLYLENGFQWTPE